MTDAPDGSWGTLTGKSCTDLGNGTGRYSGNVIFDNDNWFGVHIGGVAPLDLLISGLTQTSSNGTTYGFWGGSFNCV